MLKYPLERVWQSLLLSKVHELRGRYDQNTLHTCVKISKNRWMKWKIKYISMYFMLSLKVIFYQFLDFGIFLIQGLIYKAQSGLELGWHQTSNCATLVYQVLGNLISLIVNKQTKQKTLLIYVTDSSLITIKVEDFRRLIN